MNKKTLDLAEKLRNSDNSTNEFQMNKKRLESAGLRERGMNLDAAEKLRKSDNPKKKKKLKSAAGL
jgi:hypothetical protein